MYTETYKQKRKQRLIALAVVLLIGVIYIKEVTNRNQPIPMTYLGANKMEVSKLVLPEQISELQADITLLSD